MSTTWIFSDTHLRADTDALYVPFCELFEGKMKAGDRAVLAGDIFDIFVGGKEPFLSRFARFLAAVRFATERGVQLDYVEGNHDFWVETVFGRFKNAHVHPREVVVESTGGAAGAPGPFKVFIGHGDLVDRSDYGYRFLRAFFRSPLFGLFVRLAPGSWIDWIGVNASRKSRSQNVLLPENLDEVRRNRLRSVYREFARRKWQDGFDAVVLGHCHDFDEASEEISGRRHHYFNMGYPPKHGAYITVKDGTISRARF